MTRSAKIDHDTCSSYLVPIDRLQMLQNSFGATAVVDNDFSARFEGIFIKMIRSKIFIVSSDECHDS